MTDVQGDMRVGDEWGSIAPDFLAAVEKALDSGDQKAVRAATRELHAADLADLIQNLEQDNRVKLIAALGPQL